MTEWIQSMADRNGAAAAISRISSVLADIDRSLVTIGEGLYGVCIGRPSI